MGLLSISLIRKKRGVLLLQMAATIQLEGLKDYEGLTPAVMQPAVNTPATIEVEH